MLISVVSLNELMSDPWGVLAYCVNFWLESLEFGELLEDMLIFPVFLFFL